MDKNLLIAVGLSILVYAAWFGLVEKRVTPPQPAGVAVSTSAVSQPQAQTQAPAPAASGQPVSDEQRQAALKEAEQATIGKASVRISPRGASAVSWQYQEPLGVVELIENPVPGFFATFPDLTFRRDEKAPGVVYKARRTDGLLVTKQFVPGSENVLPQIRIALANASGKPLATGPWSISVGPGLGTIASELKENPKQIKARGLTFGQGGLNGKVEDLKPGENPGPYRWVGIDNRYFLAALLPKDGEFSGVTASLPPEATLNAASVTLAPGQSQSWEVPYYLGEKGNTWLSHYGVGLERSINFGFFAQLGRITLRCLEKIHSRIGNWGWSIIVLTILIQLLLLPLTVKSLKAQAAMKRLQPEISKLQQRYKNDPTKLNTEMMDLYKKHGANPLGGCLPMLLQMPIFYALYSTLRNAWELHGAGWIWWIKDLSAKDPHYVLPLVMGALMYGQSKFNPPTADPTQAQMMTFMPIIFTFMFLNFPAGLVLYWLTNSAANAAIQFALRNRYNQPAR